MKTLTVKIDDSLDHWLGNEAKRLGRTKSEIVREALLEQQNGEKPLSLHDRMKDVCGIIKRGPRDLATNPRYMEGFGED
jgi:predicted transcriptional regulator